MPTAFEILETASRPGGPRRIIGSAPSFADAVELAHELLPVLFLEEDDDFPGCADFITSTGLVCCIQPEGFTLTGSAAA
jgi:hypothetical protein